MTRRWRAHPRDAGFSLAELSVSVVVAGVVLAAVGTIVTAAVTTNKSTQVRLDATNSARLSVESMSRALRTAVLPRQLDNAGNDDAAFLQAAERSVFFYANINNPDNSIGPSRVSYTVSQGRLVQVVQAPLPHAPDDHDYQYCDLAQTSCGRTTTVLTERVKDGWALFKYYDKNGLQMTYTASCAGTPCLTAVGLESVDSVEIAVSVVPSSGVAIGNTTFFTRVALPNNDAVIREGSNA